MAPGRSWSRWRNGSPPHWKRPALTRRSARWVRRTPTCSAPVASLVRRFDRGGTVNIGCIGVGRMGRPIVDRLVNAGHDVIALVRQPEARAAAEAEGLTRADSVAATVDDADAVFCVVVTDEQVRSGCLGPDGAIAGMNAGATLIQHTTSDPETALLIAEEGAQRGIKVLDAALSGSQHDISAGDLTLWVGGDEATLEEMLPVLETYASPILFVGPLGNGQRVKLVNNALLVAHMGLAIDAVRV